MDESKPQAPQPRSAQTARTMAWLSGILALVGTASPSPALGLACMALGALAALPALVWGSPVTKGVAGVLLLFSLVMAGSFYPQYRQEIGRMRENAAKPQ